jgi:hypothetical protein
MIKKRKLNTVIPKAALRELGQKGYEELQTLSEWIEFGTHTFNPPNRNFKPRFRMAASIIARSEVELFCISLPRFAIRAYLRGINGNHLGFVNCRRIATICDQFDNWSSRTEPVNHRIFEKRISRPPFHRLRNSTVIADSFLQIPERYSHWVTLEISQHVAFGEDEQINGLPYVKNFDLSGLCAQSACYIATSILSEHAKGIYGLAEITQLGQSVGESSSEMEVFGFNRTQFLNYFKNPRVGLNAFWFSAPPISNSENKHNEIRRTRSIEFFTKITEIYLYSGFPIIAMVDAGRMAGISKPATEQVLAENSIYKKNRISKDLLRDWRHEDRIRTHVIVIIGYNPGRQEFLFHDPGCLPYMTATAEQIYNARAYRPLGSAPGNANSRDYPVATIIPELQFLAVMPSTVTLPLVGPISSGSPNKIFANLRDCARSIQIRACQEFQANGEASILPQSGYCFDYNNLELGESRRLLDLNVVKSFLLDSPVSDLLNQHLIRFQNDTRLRWIWIKTYSIGVRSIWLYDACGGTEDPDHFLCGFWFNGQNWSPIPPYERTFNTRIPENGARFQKTESSVSLSSRRTSPSHIGLVSSYTTMGFDILLKSWPNSLRKIEFYVFMQRDAQDFLPFRRIRFVDFRKVVFAHLRNVFRAARLPSFYYVDSGFPIRVSWFRRPKLALSRWPRPSAVARMASYSDKDRFIRGLARRIRTRFESSRIDVNSIATYIPEISASDLNVRNRGVAALVFASKLGSAFAHPKQKYTIVEFVGGSRANGVWIGTRLQSDDGSNVAFYDQERPVAKVSSRSDSLARLVDSLDQVISRSPANVILAVEVEPGPNYVLGDLESLLRFFEVIDNHPVLANRVGFNLDVAHWCFLLGKSFSDIPCSLRQRIINIHVSDHMDGGHYGDVAVGRIHNAPDTWLPFLSLTDENIFGLVPSVSIELECAGNVQQLLESINFVTAVTKS